MMTLETLRMIGDECTAQLRAINQLSLDSWVALAVSLGVALNDRAHAAKKLALRKLKAEGKL